MQAEGVRENMVVRKVFGPKEESVAGGAGKMHNKLLLLASLCYGGFGVFRTLTVSQTTWR